MKRFLSVIILLSMIVTAGCYDDSRNGVVRINLVNVPVAEQAGKRSFSDKVFSIFVKDAYAQVAVTLVKVHIAAYCDDILIAKENFAPANVVEFNVPAGENIKIIVIGEYSDGSAKSYGFTTTEIKAGVVNNVTVNVYSNTKTQSDGKSTWTTLINLSCNTPKTIVSWNAIGIPVRYHITVDSNKNGVHEYMFDGSGQIDISGMYVTTGDTYTVNVVFKEFDLESDSITKNF